MSTKKVRWVPILGGVAVGAAAAAGGYLLGQSASIRQAASETPGWLVAVTLLVAVPLPLFVHEAGHVVGGLLVRFRFVLFVAGPVMVVREGERIRLRWHRIWSLYGGIAAMVPTDDRDLLRRMSWMVAAGPLASLLLATAAAIAAFAVGDDARAWRVFFAVISFAAGMNFLAVTLPARSGGFLTDRTRFLLLRRGGPAADMVADLALLGARSQSGDRPRDWPSSALSRLMSSETTDLDTLVGRFSYLVTYFEDRGEMERALAELNRTMEHIDTLPSILYPMMWLEHAYLMATAGNNPAAARASLERVGPRAFIEPWQRDRSEAAVLHAEGRPSEAKIAAQKAIATMPASTPAGTAALVRQQLEPIAQ